MVPHHAARVSYCPTQGALRRRGLTETPGGFLGEGSQGCSPPLASARATLYSSAFHVYSHSLVKHLPLMTGFAGETHLRTLGLVCMPLHCTPFRCFPSLCPVILVSLSPTHA